MSIRFVSEKQIGFVFRFKTNGLKKAPTPRGEVKPRITRNSVKDGMLTPAGCRAPKKPGPLSLRWRTPGLHRHMRPCIVQGCLCLCGLKDAPVKGKGELLPEFQQKILELSEWAANAFGV